jgi:hypothetical protein
MSLNCRELKSQDWLTTVCFSRTSDKNIFFSTWVAFLGQLKFKYKTANMHTLHELTKTEKLLFIMSVDSAVKHQDALSWAFRKLSVSV